MLDDVYIGTLGQATDIIFAVLIISTGTRITLESRGAAFVMFSLTALTMQTITTTVLAMQRK